MCHGKLCPLHCSSPWATPWAATACVSVLLGNSFSLLERNGILFSSRKWEGCNPVHFPFCPSCQETQSLISCSIITMPKTPLPLHCFSILISITVLQMYLLRKKNPLWNKNSQLRLGDNRYSRNIWWRNEVLNKKSQILILLCKRWRLGNLNLSIQPCSRSGVSRRFLWSFSVKPASK